MQRVRIFNVLLCLLLVQIANAQDNRKGSWLPANATGIQSNNGQMVSDFLEPLRGSVRPLVCCYNGNVLKSATVFDAGKMEQWDHAWNCRIVETAVADQPDALDLEVDFSVTRGKLDSAGVALAFDFTGWSCENYVLMPAYVYNGNRFHVETNGYCAPYPSYYYYNKKVPLLFSNSPRLSEKREAAKIEGLTGNLATPAFCLFSPKDQRVCIDRKSVV